MSVHKAQVTLEFLLLFATALAFLAVWATVVVSVKERAEEMIAELYQQKTLQDVSRAIDELCILGNGNQRHLQLILIGSSSLSASGKIVMVGNQSKEVRCRTEISEGDAKGGPLLLRNVGRKIEGILLSNTDD